MPSSERVRVLSNDFAGLPHKQSASAVSNRVAAGTVRGRANLWSDLDVARFFEIDWNHDGFLTAAEIDQSRRANESVATRESRRREQADRVPEKQDRLKLPVNYRKRDVDGDGQIGLYEWLGVTPTNIHNTQDWSEPGVAASQRDHVSNRSSGATITRQKRRESARSKYRR